MPPSPGGPIRVAVVGLGKIARDQHLPALRADDRFALAATVDPGCAGIDGTAHLPGLDALIAQGPSVDAVALCTPPQMRHALAARAITAGLHVLLEKPPGATLAEVEALRSQAAGAGTTIFAAWHSRFAAAVAPAREWLSGRVVRRVEIVWREDVRTWHPGQAWIWEPGGLGVFDPGINALSIATAILPGPIVLDAATTVHPLNCAAPIAATLSLHAGGGAPITMDLDFRQTGPQTWDIRVETDQGRLVLSRGGASLTLPDDAATHFDDREYPALYDRFHALIRSGASDLDVAPFRLVADAFLLARRESTEAFFD